MQVACARLVARTHANANAINYARGGGSQYRVGATIKEPVTFQILA